MLHSQNLSEFLSRNVDPDLFPAMFLMTCSGTLLAYSSPSDVGDLRSKAAILSRAWAHKCAGNGSSQSVQLDNWLGPAGYLNTNRTSNRSGGHHHHHPQQQGMARLPTLEFLTIETRPTNVLIARLQANVVLVVLGTNPPNKHVEYEMTAEYVGDARYPPATPVRPAKRVAESAERDGGDGGDGDGDDDDGSESGNGNENENEDEDQDEAAGPDRQAADGPAEIDDWDSLSEEERDLRLGTLHIQRKKTDCVAEHLKAEFLKHGLILPANGVIP